MFLRVLPVLFCGLLAACSDPLSGLDRLNQVDLPEQDASAAALPTEEETLREGYFGTSAATGEVPSTVAAAPSERPARRGGLFDLLRPAPVNDQSRTAAGPAANSETPAQDPSSEANSQNAAIARVETATPARTGFIGRLLGGGSAKENPASNLANAPTTDAEDQQATTLAGLAPISDRSSEPSNRGLFGRPASQSSAATRRTGPDARDVAHGTTLPFGEVARSCGTQNNQLGSKIEKASAKGYTLYDSKPNTASPRTFYITGFSDGCPRQLTAANVLLGSAALYERLYYGPGGEFLPVGATDRAYEKIKRQVCGTGPRKPCGAKIKQMERSTFFVSAYSQFGDVNSWSELLIHDGQVLASAIKSNN